LEPNLLLIGLNHRTASVEDRERFWVGESRLYEALHQLAASPGIEEAVILATCNRTEFILWAGDVPAASDSLQAFLAREHALKLADWSAFYRRVGDAALRHLFRVAAGLDSMVLGEPQIAGQVKSAWTKAHQAGTTGRYLDAAFQKALSVSKRVRSETAIGAAAVSVPYAAVELARQIFGSLDGRKVMILGAGKMGELSARYLMNAGARAVWVTNRTYEHAVQLATALGGFAVPFEERWQHLADSDIVLSSTGCPHVVLTREDAERIRAGRHGRPVFLIDIAVPRDIDPAVRDVPGVFLYDIDDLERVVARNLGERQAAAAAGERIVRQEAQAFRGKLLAQRVVPTIVALRARLEEIRRRELERYRREAGPLTEAQEQSLESFAAQMVESIAGQLARELKQVPKLPEQEQLTAALRRLFRLPHPQEIERRAPEHAALPSQP
jgi:glutamyl-tRNA reductase